MTRLFFDSVFSEDSAVGLFIGVYADAEEGEVVDHRVVGAELTELSGELFHTLPVVAFASEESEVAAYISYMDVEGYI